MSEESLYSSSNLDHLGLVAGMVDEFKSMGSDSIDSWFLAPYNAYFSDESHVDTG